MGGGAGEEAGFESGGKIIIRVRNIVEGVIIIGVVAIKEEEALTIDQIIIKIF
jgi:hypothetical protein